MSTICSSKRVPFQSLSQAVRYCGCQYTVCTHVGAHVFVWLCMRGGEKGKGEGCRESEGEEEEILQPCSLIVLSIVRGSSPALWEYTLIPRDQGKEVTQPQSHTPTSIIFPPRMCYSIPQTQSQIATGVPHSPSSHLLIIVLTNSHPHCPLFDLIDANSCCISSHFIIHLFHLDVFSPIASGIFFSLLILHPSSSLLCLHHHSPPPLSSFPPPGTFLLCLFSKAPTS